MSVDEHLPSAAELIARIESAFLYPGLGQGIAPREAKLIEHWQAPLADRAEARRLNPETDWRQLDHRTLLDSPTLFSFTDVEGFRFCLPAGLRFLLRHPDWPEDSLASFTLPSLCPGGTTQQRRIDQVLPTLDSEQRAAIAAFLCRASGPAAPSMRNPVKLHT